MGAGEQFLVAEGLKNDEEVVRLAKALGAYHQYVDQRDRLRIETILDHELIRLREKVEKEERERPLVYLARAIHTFTTFAERSTKP